MNYLLDFFISPDLTTISLVTEMSDDSGEDDFFSELISSWGTFKLFILDPCNWKQIQQ